MVLKSLLQTPVEFIFTYIRQIRIIDLLFETGDFLGISCDLISVPILYSMFYFLFDKKLWKTKWINKWLEIPNLNGIWKGKAKSSFDETREYSMELEIEQTWSKIKFVSIFPDTNSKSESNSATFFIEANGDKKVGFAFTNRSREVHAQQYDGYNILELDSEEKISGRYFNNRDNSSRGLKGGNKGQFTLKKES